MKKEVVEILKKSLKEIKIKLSEEEIEKFVEVPSVSENGDFAFPCFYIAKQLKMNPHQVALELRSKIGNSPQGFEDIQTAGAYVNFFVDKKSLANIVLKEILTQKQNFGRGNISIGQNIVLEYSSPNIAKPFGIGHLRSTIIGNSLANISEFQGFKTTRINYLGDWGTQFGKLIFGYTKFGDKKKLKKNPVKHLFDIYVKVNKNEKYDEESREYFKRLEKGDKNILEIWRYFRELSLQDFEKIYNKLNIKFDVFSGESMCDKMIPQIIEELKMKKLLVKSEGALVVDLKKYNLGVCIIQKTDGATLYAVRDIVSAIMRYNKYKFNYMFYEVGQEQKFYFQQIFKILELMGYTWAQNCKHIWHGFYLDSDGKKFATRKGKTVFMEDIINKTISLAEKEIKKRVKRISKKELARRASKITIAAIFYGDLKNNRKNNMVFDISKFVSFEGDTGPYLLYSYARANSVIKKSKIAVRKNFKILELEDKEAELVKKLSQFAGVVSDANRNLNPSLIANYSYELAKIFNEFYHACPVIGSAQESFRVALLESFKQVLQNALLLLGIETLDKM